LVKDWEGGVVVGLGGCGGVLGGRGLGGFRGVGIRTGKRVWWAGWVVVVACWVGGICCWFV
jgi:hypothetical protein